MLDVEVPGQALLQLVQQLWQVPVVEAGVVHHDVRGEHRQVRGDQAGMQVMHRVHVRHAEDVGTHMGQVDALRGGVHQHVHRLAQQLPCPSSRPIRGLFRP